MELQLLLLGALLLLYVALSLKFRRRANRRHLTDEYSYAHFSQITRANRFFFPELLLSRSTDIEIGPGEALWIPQGWWHWIRSDPGTVAVGFWFLRETRPSLPEVVALTLEPNQIQELERLMDMSEAEIWNSRSDEVRAGSLFEGDDQCIMTLAGYSSTKKRRLNEKLQKDLARMWQLTDTDINLWATLGRHDTGLHYDDVDGLLLVIRGRKKIRLFPPSQGRFLAPLSVLPSWAEQTPQRVKYNFNEYRDVLDARSNWPSGRLLYESVKRCSGNKRVLLEISSLKEPQTEYIWGCKWQNGQMRWELYTYLFRNSVMKAATELHLYPMLRGKQVPPDLHIVSMDLFDDETVRGPIEHCYWSRQPLQLPYWGWGTQNGAHESRFVVDQRARLKNNASAYLRSIGIEDVDLGVLEYPCEEVCVNNKSENSIYIQYLGISFDDFVLFLRRNSYPQALLDHIADNAAKYRNLVHEVTQVYDRQTGEYVRSGFYGNL